MEQNKGDAGPEICRCDAPRIAWSAWEMAQGSRWRVRLLSLVKGPTAQYPAMKLNSSV